MYLLLSIFPFVVFLFLLLRLKTSLLRASLITLAIVIFLDLDVWRVFSAAIYVSTIKGFTIALDILWIILGAVFFLEILKKTGVIANLCSFLEGFSKDYRVQIIFLAWFLENFIEGTAGFGTPAAIVAPLLVGMGLTPLTAVVISLLGNSASVAFGAAGTPIRVGFAGIVASGIPFYTVAINFVGLLVPVFMLYVATAGRMERKKEFLEALPFALWSGVVFSVFSLLTVFLGQEFPSILGSVLSLFVVIITVKLKIFTPKNIIDPHHAKPLEIILPKFNIFFPYAILIGLLIAGKFALRSFNPGVAFLLASIPTVLVFKEFKSVVPTVKIAVSRTFEPFLVILAMSTLVQLMIMSNLNASGLPSSLSLIANSLHTRQLPFIVPFVGAFGAFITGSATISNIMFGKFLEIVANNTGFSVAIILALELVGAAAGNMIALVDILAAETVVGIKAKETAVLKQVIVPCLIYIALVGVVGMLILRP